MLFIFLARTCRGYTCLALPLPYVLPANIGNIFALLLRQVSHLAHKLLSSRFGLYTAKKERKIFLIYKEIQKGAVAKSYRQTPIFRHPFFRKQCFSLKYVLVAPLKIFGGMSKFGIYVICPVYNFNSARALKSYCPPVSKLPPLCQTPTHRRI
jgi:hypothetical protein